MYKMFRDLGIDLGTSSVLIYSDGKGIVLREPSVVAINKNDGRVFRVGGEAHRMLGRTPGNIEAVRPMPQGVITDYDMTEKLLSAFIRKAAGYRLVKPRAIITVPSGITEMEERSVIQAALEAGVRRVYLIERPLAAARGAKLDLSGPSGHMVVDMGAGITDIAVLTMNGVAVSSSVRAGGDSFDEAVSAYARKHHNLLIGADVAERIKIEAGCAAERPEEIVTGMKGRDLKTGLPREERVSSSELFDVFRRPARQLVDEILRVLEQTSPELVADLTQNGIVLTGGASQLYGMAELVSQRTGLPCRVADDPASCAAVGCGMSLRWIRGMQEGTINLARRKLVQEA